MKLLDLLLDGPQFVTEGGAVLLARVVALVDFPGEHGPIVVLARPSMHPRCAPLAHLRVTVQLVGARVVAAL